MARHGDRDDRWHDRRSVDTVVLTGPFVGYDPGRSWEPEGYNDWWHERPHRSYPRWVQHNEQCDRMWWGGGAYRCGW